MVILPILVGVNLFIEYATTNELTIYLFSAKEEQGKHISKFELYNEGSPISKYELIQPLVVNVGDENAIIDFDLISKEPTAIKVWFNKLTKNKLKIDFDLLNESENITFQIETRKPVDEFTVSSRIKNIEDIVTYHYKVKPKFYDRISVIWLLLMVFSIISFLDAMLLIGKDKELAKIKQLINSFSVDTNQTDFLEHYKMLYSNYNVRFKRNKSGVVNEVEAILNQSGEESLSVIKEKLLTTTKKAVLYNLRKPYLLISPVIFVICIIAIVVSIVYYATF